MFVDHAGDTLAVRDPASGGIRPAYLFVAVPGAGNYTYAEAAWTRDLMTMKLHPLPPLAALPFGALWLVKCTSRRMLRS